MSRVAGSKCWHCGREIALNESHWAYHYMGGMSTSVCCLTCLVFIDGPQVEGLLDLASQRGVSVARAYLKKYMEPESTPERSEP